jgi:hypothetical protein
METIARGTPEWQKFVIHQCSRIRARIDFYLDRGIAQEELISTGDLTPYRSYKSGTMAPILTGVLLRVDQGQYGICVVCGGEIPFKRLELVPAALACVDCDDKR